jgi:hypothetical protein
MGTSLMVVFLIDAYIQCERLSRNKSKGSAQHPYVLAGPGSQKRTVNKKSSMPSPTQNSQITPTNWQQQQHLLSVSASMQPDPHPSPISSYFPISRPVSYHVHCRRSGGQNRSKRRRRNRERIPSRRPLAYDDELGVRYV